MARLTWQNVAAPELGDAARILESGFQGFANGANGIADTLLGIRERQKTNRSAAAFDVLAGVASEGDVGGALARIASMVAPQDRTADLQKALMSLREGALGFDSTRASTRATVDSNNRQNVTHSRQIRKEDQAGAAGAAYAGGLRSTFRESLGQSESGGNYNAVNDEGFVGKYQWGQDRLDDYNRATGMRFTLEDLKNPKIGEAAQAWHEQDILKDLGKFAGTRVNGQVLDENAIVAMAHLGGKGGARRYIETGGRYDPADSNGTNLSDYARKFGNQGDWLGTIGEGNLLSIEEIQRLASGEQTYFDNIERNADANRDRDTTFAEQERQKVLSVAGQNLATQMLGEAAYPEDVPVLINRADVPTEVKQAALAFLGQNEALAAANFSTLYDPNASGPAGGSQAVTAIDAALAVQENAILSDNSMRIQSNATNYGNEPAPVLAKEMGDLSEDGLARTSENIDEVVSRAKTEHGISLTPAQAAALIKENLYQGRVWNPLENNDYLYADVDGAVAMAADTLTPEQISASAERMSQYERTKGALEKDKEDLSKVGQALLVAQNAANPNQDKIGRLQNDYDKILARISDRAESLGAGGNAPAPAATSDNGSGNAEARPESSTQPASTTPAPEAALQEAELAIAANAIVKATDGRMTPERLAQMPQDQQIMVLGGILDELIARNAPEAEIAAVERVMTTVQQGRQQGVSTTVPQASPARVDRPAVQGPPVAPGPSLASRLIDGVASRLPSAPDLPGARRIGDALASLRADAPTQQATAPQNSGPAPETRAAANKAMTSFLARPQTAMQNPEAFMQALGVLEASLPANHPVLRQAQALAVRISVESLSSGAGRGR